MTSKNYHSARTPCQRILLSDHICQAMKDLLTQKYESKPRGILRALMINETQFPLAYAITPTGVQVIADHAKLNGKITQSLA